jgi:hypothetical protein
VIDPKLPGEPRSFTVEMPGLADLGLDPGARIYVEPYVGTSSMRFDYGTVAGVTTPPDTTLDELDAGSGVLFRVKIVDESGAVGKILASANAIRPANETEEDDRKALLPVAYRDLGEAIWMLDVQPGVKPQLVLNNLIPGLGDLIRNHPLFQGAIVSHAVRRVLEVIYLENECDDNSEWVKDWKTFAETVRGGEIDDDEEEEALKQILDEVVASFVAGTKWVTNFKQQQTVSAGKINE